MFYNKSTHAYSIINVVFRVSFYGYTICFTNLNYDMYDFRFALAFYGTPTRPQLVALVAQVRCVFHVYVCFVMITMVNFLVWVTCMI